MTILSKLRLPFDAAQVLTGAKSFEKNGVLGSPYLNRRGLHRTRVRWAQTLAERRQDVLLQDVAPELHAPIRQQGYARIDNFLPDDVYAQVRAEMDRDDFDRIDMKQGKTITRRAHLDRKDVADRPGFRHAVEDPRLKPLIRAVASYSGQPLICLQVVMANGGGDPQAMLHSDTFHATAKAWLFLKDVPDDGGPFLYVPGSHLVTPERYDWEDDIAINAAALENRYAARGSLRVPIESLGELGYGQPVRFAVPANTLIVADTHGFHARAHSEQATVRMEIYSSLRRNPFIPFVASKMDGLHGAALPGLKHRIGRAAETGLGLRQKLGGKSSPWTSQGKGGLDEVSSLMKPR